MRRGASAGPSSSGSSTSGSHVGFRGAEQSLHVMRQVKSYFNVGMDHVLEVAADMAEYGKDDKDQAKQLRQIMLNYLQMERDMDNFMQAANDIISEGGDGEEQPGELVRRLERRVKELSKGNSDDALKEHERFLELQQKIWDSQNLEALPGTLGAAGRQQQQQREGGEEEVELTQEQVNTRCPYTGREMVDPVRNVICRHTYDRAGILQHIKQRGKKAICPVGGCTNNKPITSRDLEENKEMRRYILNKNRRLQHPASSTAPIPSTSTGQTSQSSQGSCALVIQE